MNRHVGPNTRSAAHTAKREVKRAENALSQRLEEAGVAGHATVEQALGLVRPLVISAVAAAGLVWLVSALRRPRRRGFVLPERTRPSVLNDALRAASLSLASAAARSLGQHLFATADAAQSTRRDELSRLETETNH